MIMRFGSNLGCLTILAAVALAAGCRAHPASLAVMLIGDVIDDVDVEQRAAQLEGQVPSTADRMFGPRYNTLNDLRTDDQWLVYRPSDLERVFFVATVSGGRIVGLTKARQDADGFEDVVHRLDLEARLLGNRPAECEREANLGQPAFTVHSRRTGSSMRIYDVTNWTDTRGARYCLLDFDQRERCNRIRMVGVTAASREDDISP